MQNCTCGKPIPVAPATGSLYWCSCDRIWYPDSWNRKWFCPDDRWDTKKEQLHSLLSEAKTEEEIDELLDELLNLRESDNGRTTKHG